MIGSLSVMAIKGFGLALTLTLGGIQNEMGNWITWFCVVALVVTVGIQMNFLNKALDTFNTAVVTPIYYVMFTSCVITASAILFREFDAVSPKDWVGLICGFSVVLTAIVLLHFCKNFEVTLSQLAEQISFTKKPEVGDEEEGLDSAVASGERCSSNEDDDDTASVIRGVKDPRFDHSDANVRLLGVKPSKDLITYGTNDSV